MQPAQTQKADSAGPSRRRVRTGCLTCRRRRRKCDEAKPKCQNCTDKSLTCHYGVKLVFLDSTPDCFSGKRRQGEAVQDATLAPETSNDQADNVERVDSPPIDTTPSSVSSVQPSAPSPYLDQGDSGSRTELDSFSAPAPAPVPLPPDELQRQESDESSGLSILCGVAHAADYAPTSPLLAQEAPPRLSHHQELRLLSHYRQRIAPLLDLGLSREYFGVQIFTASPDSSIMRRALFALAACHSPTQDPDVLAFMRATDLSTNTIDSHPDQVIAALFLAWSNVYTTSPASWAEMIARVLDLHHQPLLNTDQWHLLARLLLSSVLLSSSSLASYLPLLPAPSFQLPNSSTHSEHQFLNSIIQLQRSVEFTSRQNQPRRTSNFPAASAWQLCWSECQVWFATRNLAMEEMLTVSEVELKDGATQFPVIVFSNACAFVANIVHHLTCLVLLQHRFRTVRVIAEADSSISPIWHARRIVGICASTDESDRWDPLVIAALVHASRRLSHEAQLGVVADILRTAARQSGMMLNAEIEKIASQAYVT